jgi:hypothetical protein
MEKPASLICLLCLLICCGPKQDEVERVSEDGVEVVINHLEPYEIKGEPSNLILEEIFAIDTEKDEIAEMGLIDIETFDVDSKGNIYLMLRQTSENFIHKFDDKGSFITSFCRKGQGPGEADWGGSILIDEYDRVIAKDMTKRKFFIFNPDGTLVEEIKMEKNYSLVEYLGEDKFLIFSQEVEGEDRMFQNRIGIADGTFEEIKMFYQFEFQHSQLAERYTPVSRGFVLGTSENSIFIGKSRDKYEIHVYDAEGNLERKIWKEYIPVDISDDYKRIIKKRLESIPAAQALAKKMYFPPHWPPFRYLFTDDKGRLFVMTYEKGDNEREYMYDIFNADGAFIGRMSLGNIQVIYIENERYHDEPKKVLVKGDLLYCIQEKDSGFIELVVYKMMWE